MYFLAVFPGIRLEPTRPTGGRLRRPHPLLRGHSTSERPHIAVPTVPEVAHEPELPIPEAEPGPRSDHPGYIWPSCYPRGECHRADAVSKYSAKTQASDGTIEVTATNVSGNLGWGGEGDIRSSQRITPPRNCSIFLADPVSTCEIYLKGCTPGLCEETASTGEGGGSNSDLDEVPSMQLINGVEVPYVRTPRTRATAN